MGTVVRQSCCFSHCLLVSFPFPWHIVLRWTPLKFIHERKAMAEDITLRCISDLGKVDKSFPVADSHQRPSFFCAQLIWYYIRRTAWSLPLRLPHLSRHRTTVLCCNHLYTDNSIDMLINTQRPRSPWSFVSLRILMQVQITTEKQ